MEFDDYRTTKYCEKFENIKQKKTDFETELRKEHPRAEDIHAIVSDNSSHYKLDFMKIYNCKCSYCGVSIRLVQRSDFEIDHIVAKSSFSSKAEASHLDNLALACRNCNRNKSDFLISNNLINPDENINKYFYRDDLFNVCICPDYINCSVVVEFYKKLQLGENLHRLDYILMNLFGIQKAYKEKYGTDLELIGDAINILVLKRNLYS